MGKGDKKTRRGKIILGSTGVRRPKSSKSKGLLKSGTASAEVIEKLEKVSEKPKTETKPKLKKTNLVSEVEIKNETEPKKAVKKAVKKAKEEETTE